MTLQHSWLCSHTFLRSRLCPALPVTRAARFQARSPPCATAGCSPGSHGHYFSVAGSRTQSSPLPAPPICNKKKKSHRACLSENDNVHGALTILFLCPGIGLDAPICLDSIQGLGELCKCSAQKQQKSLPSSITASTFDHIESFQSLENG